MALLKLSALLLLAGSAQALRAVAPALRKPAMPKCAAIGKTSLAAAATVLGSTSPALAKALKEANRSGVSHATHELLTPATDRLPKPDLSHMSLGATRPDPELKERILRISNSEANFSAQTAAEGRRRPGNIIWAYLHHTKKNIFDENDAMR